MLELKMREFAIVNIDEYKYKNKIDIPFNELIKI
jgi:hypothetical protein